MKNRYFNTPFAAHFTAFYREKYEREAVARAAQEIRRAAEYVEHAGRVQGRVIRPADPHLGGVVTVTRWTVYTVLGDGNPHDVLTTAVPGEALRALEAERAKHAGRRDHAHGVYLTDDPERGDQEDELIEAEADASERALDRERGISSAILTPKEREDALHGEIVSVSAFDPRNPKLV